MTKCYLCNSTNVAFKYRVDTYNYYHCQKCLSMFIFPKPDKSKINSLYLDFPYKAGKSESNRIKRRAGYILKQLSKFYPKGKSLLDIGSGYGYFLEVASKFNFRSYGIEPSKNLYKFSTSVLKNNSKIHHQTFEDFIKTNKTTYDFITLTHVIEHTHNPQKTIKDALSILNSNGVLYIETPNSDSWLAKSEKNKYTFLTPPDHVWIFSINSLKKLIGSNKILKISTYSYPEHLMGIVKKILIGKKNIKTANVIYDKTNKQYNYLSNIKYYLFDRILAPLLTPLLDINNKGSIIEIYIRKQS